MAAGALAATVSLAPACAQAAGLLNGSFEDILAGWDADHDLVSIRHEIYHRDQTGAPDKLFEPVDGFTGADGLAIGLVPLGDPCFAWFAAKGWHENFG